MATIAALTDIKNKIPDVSDLVKKINYDAKIKEIGDKNFTTLDYNKFTNEMLDTRIINKKKN